MNKPNFLVVGAAKCGTTSLDGYLKQHPEVFLPEMKECRYFSDVKDKNIDPFTKQLHTHVIFDLKEYYDLFKNTDAKAIGDISPDYLYYYEESIKNIKRELGDNTKIIIVLRNPVQRAHSNYLHLRREEYTDKSFEEIIELEKSFDSSIWYGFRTIDAGFYYDAVKSYLKNFKNVKIIIFEEFITNTDEILIDLCNFLEINEKFILKKPELTNKTGIPKSKMIDSITKGKIPLKNIIKPIIFKVFSQDKIQRKLKKLRDNNLVKPKLEERIRIRLNNMYSNDIENLEKLLGRDLTIWK